MRLIVCILAASALFAQQQSEKPAPAHAVPHPDAKPLPLTVSREVLLEIQALETQRNAVQRIAEELVARAKELLDLATARESQRVQELLRGACKSAGIPMEECGGIENGAIKRVPAKK
jgi:hypothetical protein